MDEPDDTPRGKGYVWAELGALFGAAAAAVGVVVIVNVQIALKIAVGLEDLYGLWSVAAPLAVIAAASISCGLTLRRRSHRAPGATAIALLAMLLVILAAAWLPGDPGLQSTLYPYAFGLALVTPLAARAVALKLKD